MEKYFRVDNRIIDEIRFDNACEFGVYMIILRFGNNGQIAYPSLDFMRERLRTSNRKILIAIESLESKGMIEITRINRRCNWYRVVPTPVVVSPTKNEILTSTVEENKEKEINSRRELLDEIYNLISKGTGDNIFLIQQIFTGRGLTDDELVQMRDKIMESDFLMGKSELKPTIRNYDSIGQIDKVRFGYYRNRKREKKTSTSEYKPPYQYEFKEKKEIKYESNY